MKIAVLIKSVPDTATLLRIGEDGKSVAIDNVKPVTNPYDEYAVEEAVKLKEAVGGEVLVVSMGDDSARKIIRTALAAGADSGLFVNCTDTSGMTGRSVSKVLAAALDPFGADLIFAGKQAVDDDALQVPERIAELLGLPHASCITRFALSDGKAQVDREIDGGNCTVEFPLPALFTVSKGINTPRYPTLPNIMKAKRKEIRETTPEELGFGTGQSDPGLVVDRMLQPRQQRLLKILDGEIRSQAKQLVELLDQSAG